MTPAISKAESASTLEIAKPLSGKRTGVRILGGALVVLAALALYINLTYAKGGPARDHLQRGIEMANARRPADAEKEWREAIKLDPTQTEPYALLSRLYLAASRPKQAIPLLERLRQIAPRQPHVFCNLAEAYARAEMPQKGLEAARQAVIMEPSCPQAHGVLGVFLGDAEDTRGALRELSQAHALAPTDDQIAISYAQAQLDANDFPGAQQTAAAVATRNKGYATAWYTLGRACSRLQPTPENLKAAIDAYQRATDLNPLYADAFSEIGRLRVMAGDYRGAVTALEHIWNRGVRNKETAFNLAAAYRKLGDTARADRMAAEFKHLSDFSTQYTTLQKHLSVEPNNVEVAYRLAKLDMDSGNLNDAMALVQGILQRTPRDRRVLALAVDLSERLHQTELGRAYRARLSALESDEKALRAGH